jgi:LPPG:FO 2-phospho-L-lactate transferase
LNASRPQGQRVVALSGGIGGAKLVEGLTELLPLGMLSVVCNVGDDLEVWGLHVSPDIDTVMYTLSGLADRDRGWGLESESFQALELMKRYGEPVWFQLGDRDLATHILRTRMLREGMRLTEVTIDLCRRLDLRATLLPATDDPVRTIVRTPDGDLDFQDYFVRRRFEPPVEAVRFDGADLALPSPEALSALLSAETVIIAPSNPVASIGPILAVPGIHTALSQAGGTRVAVSPLVGGDALKGPTVAMMQAAGLPLSPVGVALGYKNLIDAIVIDREDHAYKPELEGMGLRVLVTDIVMEGYEGRLRLAAEVLDFSRSLARL